MRDKVKLRCLALPALERIQVLRKQEGSVFMDTKMALCMALVLSCQCREVGCTASTSSRMDMPC